MKRPDWLSFDNSLIVLVLAVTVARAGHVIAQWEQPGLERIGYAAALAIDLLTLRFAYAWRRSTWGGKPWLMRLAAFLCFALWAGGVQYVYMAKAAANWFEALLLSAIWPVAIVSLAVNEAMTDSTPKRPTDMPQPPRLTVRQVRSVTVAGAAAVRSRGQRVRGLDMAASGADVTAIVAALGCSDRTARRYVREARNDHAAP
jgi:hypothetical protein